MQKKIVGWKSGLWSAKKLKKLLSQRVILKRSSVRFRTVSAEHIINTERFENDKFTAILKLT